MKKRNILFTICFCPTVLFAQVSSSKIYTDFNGFWESMVPGAPIPDNSHNLLAFKVGTTIYSTGVNDNVLTTNGINFSPQNFTALPIATNPDPIDGTYIGVGKMFAGSGDVSPIPVDLPTAQYLRDGIKGLDIGSAIFNFPASTEINYLIDGITLSSIGDGVPDLMITQMGKISNVQDRYMFKDAAGNTIGTEYSVDLSTIQSLGLFRWKFYNAHVNPPTYNTVVGPNDSNNTRDVRVVTLDWADLGITSTNAGQVKRFVQIFSGQSDLSFTAYNAGSINLRMPVSGNVFIDNNGGVPNGKTYQNATVALKNSSGSTVTSTSTDIDGRYFFDNVAQGNYSIALTVPAEYQMVGNSDGQVSNTMNIQVTDTPIQNKNFGIYRLPCVKPGALGTPNNYAKMGILTKKSITVSQWPKNVPNAHLVIDSDSKGFVITHMTTTQRNALIPVVGMIIYNTNLQAVQIYRGNNPGVDTSRLGWSSITRACNEE